MPRRAIKLSAEQLRRWVKELDAHLRHVCVGPEPRTDSGRTVQTTPERAEWILGMEIRDDAEEYTGPIDIEALLRWKYREAD